MPPDKFQNKYRIPSARLRGYDYAADGAYFVTICTHNRENFFGEIIETRCTVGNVGTVGTVVETHCNASLPYDRFPYDRLPDDRLPGHRQRKMQLSDIGKIVADEWQKTDKIRKNVELGAWVVMPNHLHAVVIIHNNNCRDRVMYKNKFGPQSQNLSAIIRGFKGATTKQIHLAGFADFAWQPRFHDHIIRNDDEMNRIRKYIENNPLNWTGDKNNI